MTTYKDEQITCAMRRLRDAVDKYEDMDVVNQLGSDALIVGAKRQVVDSLCEQAEYDLCRKCGKRKDNVEDRLSFGVYAGHLCEECCGGFRDNCGLDGDQGDPAELDEQYWEDE